MKAKKTRKARRQDPARGHRDPRGRFQVGCPGGPGRPPLPVELANLEAIAGAMGPAEWAKLTARMHKEAIEGDWKARDWLAAHTLEGATLAELRKLLLPAAGEPRTPETPPAEARELSDLVIRQTLSRMQEKLEHGRSLSEEEVEQALNITRVLNETTVTEKTPDLSDFSPEKLEDLLLAKPPAPATTPPASTPRKGS